MTVALILIGVAAFCVAGYVVGYSEGVDKGRREATGGKRDVSTSLDDWFV